MLYNTTVQFSDGTFSTIHYAHYFSWEVIVKDFFYFMKDKNVSGVTVMENDKGKQRIILAYVKPTEVSN